jgi:hypothetical protein
MGSRRIERNKKKGFADLLKGALCTCAAVYPTTCDGDEKPDHGSGQDVSSETQ